MAATIDVVVVVVVVILVVVVVVDTNGSNLAHSIANVTFEAESQRYHRITDAAMKHSRTQYKAGIRRYSRVCLYRLLFLL